MISAEVFVIRENCRGEERLAPTTDVFSGWSEVMIHIKWDIAKG